MIILALAHGVDVCEILVLCMYARLNQGAGVGSALYRALFARAREMGVAAIVAVVGTDNAGSVRLHERAGFALVGTAVEVGWKFGQWQDRAFYCARLDADE